MTKIMMIGGNGRVGKYMQKLGYKNLECDVTFPVVVSDALWTNKPDIILLLAAKSSIEWCEQPENLQETINVNFRGTFNVLESAEKIGAKVVMISSDHVFSSCKGGWWGSGPYNEDAKPFPINLYGQTKLAAEGLQREFDNFKVVRTSYLFDWQRLQPKLGQPQPTFIKRSFMYLPHFCNGLHYYLQNYDTMPKLLHLSGSKTVSWFDFMRSFTVVKPKTKEDKTMTKRPLRAGLKTKYDIFQPTPYQLGVDDMLKNAKQ
jgi:dTDP-4-dehydrorhamnose reductase